MTRALYCGDFPALQVHFIENIGASRRTDPLAPLDVLVPGHLLRMALSRALANSGFSHANLRFHTLSEYARHLAEPKLRMEHRQLLPDVVHGSILKAVIESKLPNLNYYREVASRRGFRETLSRTLSELELAGLSPDLLATISERHASGLLTRKLSDLVTLWRAYHQLLIHSGYVNHSLLLILARDLAGQGNSPQQPLVVYGLHELSTVERGFLQALFSGRPTSIYLPYRDTAPYQWVKPLYDWFCQQGFTPVTLPPPETANPAAKEASVLPNLRQRVQRYWMTDAPLPPAGIPKDNSVLIISAPDAPREAQEIVRELLFPTVKTPEDGLPVNHPPHLPQPTRGNIDPDRIHSITIRVPPGDPLADLVREELGGAGVQAYLHEQRLADTVAGRSIRRLVRLLDGRFRRAEVMELFLSTPLRRLSTLPDSLPSVPAAEWNHFSLLAGVIEGEDSWKNHLPRLKCQFESRRTSDENEQLISERRLDSLRAMMVTIEWLFAEIREIAASNTWKQKSNRLWKLFEELVQSDSSAAVVKSEFEYAGDLDRMNLPVSADSFATFVDAVLFRPVARSGRFQVNDPAVGTPAELLGVISDDVFIPGMAEKQVPRPVPQDPILLDEERTRLEEAARALGVVVSLSKRTRLKEREIFLFYTALTCATRRLVLSYSRLDMAKEGRERLPSSFLLRVLEAATGSPADYAALDEFIRQHGRRLSINRLRSPLEPAATRFQYEIARLAEALQQNSPAPLADKLLNGFLHRAAAADRKRFGMREFTIFDGLIADETLRHNLQREIAPRLSPTRMERYAHCPFRFFAESLLQLKETLEPEPVQPITPLEYGQLIHNILERFYRTEHEAKRLPPVHESMPRLLAAAEAQFARFEREQPIGLPLLWELKKQEIREVLTEYLETEIQRRDEFIPSHFEKRFGYDSPLVYRLPDGTELPLLGKVDRIDVSSDGRARVVDYKTGKTVAKFKDGQLQGGHALQLPLYRLAVATLLELDMESAAYHILASGAKKDVIRFTADDWRNRLDDFHRIVQTIADGVRQGEFFPRPSNDCRTCPVRRACGTGSSNIKWQFLTEQTAKLRELSEIE